MRFVVYGAGAIGGVIGGRLVAARPRRRPDRARCAPRSAARARVADRRSRARRDLAGARGRRSVRDRRSTVRDVVILAMKTQDTELALRTLVANASPDAAIVCAQNGVENERLALRHFAGVYAMCVMCPAQHVEPGVVEAASDPIAGLLGPRLLSVGCRRPCRCDRVRVVGVGIRVGAAARHHALEVHEAVDEPRQRGRGVVRTGRCRRRRAVAARSERRRSCAARGGDRRRVRGKKIASGAGTLQPRPIGGAPRGGGSSWQSLRRGTGSIESDYLNGEIVVLGRMHGVDTPVNALLQRRGQRSRPHRRRPRLHVRVRPCRPPVIVRSVRPVAELSAQTVFSTGAGC